MGAEATQETGGETQRRTIVSGDAPGRSGSRLDLVQGARQQAALGKQGVDGWYAQWHGGGTASALGAVRSLESAYALAQACRDRKCPIIGDRGSKDIWGNDRHRPLDG